MGERYILGKHAPKHDYRTLKFENYLTYNLPAPLMHCGWLERMKFWPMDLNDQIGCCVVAAVAHLIQLWTTYTLSSPLIIPDTIVEKVYSDITGYDPKTGKNDDGMAMLDILRFWSKPKNDLGDVCSAYMQATPQKHDEIKQAIRFFGGSLLGLNLPEDCQTDIGKGRTWHVKSGKGSAPGSWGGHCVPVVSYDPTGLICVTWGNIQKLTWQFLDKYCDEAWVVLSRDWINLTKNIAPNGFNWIQLQSDLQAIPHL